MCSSVVHTVNRKVFSLVRLKGGVVSPFLFNILMHRLLTSLPDIPGVTITCYADDICVHSTSPMNLQLFLASFSVSSTNCGIIVSPDKSRIFSCRPPATLPDYIVGGTVIPLCTQYCNLGAPVKISQIFPAGRQAHPLIRVCWNVSRDGFSLSSGSPTTRRASPSLLPGPFI